MSKLYNLKKAAWYSVENITTIAFGLVSVVMVARFFGPENLGKLSMVQTISAITLFLVVLGLDQLIIRDLSNKKRDLEYISTVLIMQFSGFILHIISVFLVLYYVYDGMIEHDVMVIAFSVLLTVYFSRATVIKLYFQSINRPEVIALSAITSRVIAIIYMFYALINGYTYPSVITFIPLQAFVQIIIIFIIFLRMEDNNNFNIFKFNPCIAKNLFKEAMPLMASSILFPLFMQADILLISFIMSENEVGIYSAASRLITQFLFVGSIVTMTFYLGISSRINEKSLDEEKYIQGVLAMILVIAIIMSSSVFIFSDYIINTLYGDKFNGSEKILEVLSWEWLLILPAALYSRLLILYGLIKYEFIKSLIVAVFSLSLNYLLIPKFGILAAAYVSLFSYFIADLMVYFVFRKTRFLFYIGVKTILLFFTNPREVFSRIIYTLSYR